MKKVKSKNINTGAVDVPLGDITANPKHNARTTVDPGAVEDLANSMKVQGQVQAVRVEKLPSGKFDLVFGFRRVAAAKLLGWDTIRAEVVEPMGPTERKIANVAENMARENLSTYDQAMAFHDLRQTCDLSGVAIANSVGKSVPYTNNLLRIAEGLDASIVRRWREECSPNFGRDKEGKKLPNINVICTMEWLGKTVANVPRAKQEHELKVAMGLVDPEEDEDGDGEGRGRSDPGAPKRHTMKTLAKALEAAEGKLGDTTGEDLHHLRGVVAGLKFAMGKTQGIKGVWQNPKPVS